MKALIVWTGGPLEFTATRGRLVVAKITCQGTTCTLYDRREQSEGLGELKATGISLDEAKRRAEEDLNG